MPMDWQDMRESNNVEDQRGSRPSLGGVGPGRGYSLGLGGVVIALIGSVLFGLNPIQVLNTISGVSDTSGGYAPTTQSSNYYPQNDVGSQFTKKVLGDLEDQWTQIFQQGGGQFQAPKLVLFTGAVNSGCGLAESASGPFYCPTDRKIYLDLAFFNELQTLRSANNEFARAYVIAHEFGHHVQNLMGISDQVEQAQARSSKAQGNALSVRLELQADCFAGVWGHTAAQRKLIDTTDAAQAVATAQQIGDDYLQKQARGYATPESFTHGTSAQRAKWFQTGYSSGDWHACDTFNNPI